jgi:hypothetical protein
VVSEPSQEHDDLAPVVRTAQRRVVAHARAGVDERAPCIGREADRHDLVRAPAERGGVMGDGIAADEDQLRDVAERRTERHRLDGAACDADPPQAIAASGDECRPVGQNHQRTVAGPIGQPRDGPRGASTGIHFGDLAGRGIENEGLTGATGDDVGEAAAGAAYGDHGPAHREARGIDELDCVRREHPEASRGRVVSELEDRMRGARWAHRRDDRPVRPDHRDRAGRVARDEEAIVHGVVRDGRRVKPRVDRQRDLGRLAAGHAGDRGGESEGDDEATHGLCSVSVRPVQYRPLPVHHMYTFATKPGICTG